MNPIIFLLLSTIYYSIHIAFFSTEAGIGALLTAVPCVENSSLFLNKLSKHLRVTVCSAVRETGEREAVPTPEGLPVQETVRGPPSQLSSESSQEISS